LFRCVALGVQRPVHIIEPVSAGLRQIYNRRCESCCAASRPRYVGNQSLRSPVPFASANCILPSDGRSPESIRLQHPKASVRGRLNTSPADVLVALTCKEKEREQQKQPWPRDVFGVHRVGSQAHVFRTIRYGLFNNSRNKGPLITILIELRAFNLVRPVLAV